MTYKFLHLLNHGKKIINDIIDGKMQSFEIRIIQYDFEKEEYYYFPIPDTFAGKIYESKATLTEEPKSSAMEVYELLFANKKKSKKTD